MWQSVCVCICRWRMRNQHDLFPTIDEHIQWDWVRLPNHQKNMQMVVKCVCVYGAWPKVGHSMPPKIRTFLVVMVIAGRNVAIHQTQALFSVWHSCPKQNQWFHVTQLSNLKLTGHLPACVAPGSCLSGSTSWQNPCNGPWAYGLMPRKLSRQTLSTLLPRRTNSGIVHDPHLKSFSGCKWW